MPIHRCSRVMLGKAAAPLISSAPNNNSNNSNDNSNDNNSKNNNDTLFTRGILATEAVGLMDMRVGMDMWKCDACACACACACGRAFVYICMYVCWSICRWAYNMTIAQDYTNEHPRLLVHSFVPLLVHAHTGNKG